jgi:SecD/SecF fusion protein
MIDSGDEKAAEKVMERLFVGVNNIAGNKLNFDNFSDPEGNGTHVVSSSQVGPTVAEDIKESSLEAALFALALIFLYIFIRFSKWQYSAGAVIALFHDTIITLGVFSALHGILPFSMEIDQAFIAAILTVIGYSINDTVVVFDRIREMMGIYTKRSKNEVINKAINNTLSRTTLTSLTTLFVVIILFLFGGSSIKGFSFAILFGITIGTYSSIFVASPLMSDLTKKDEAGKS